MSEAVLSPMAEPLRQPDGRMTLHLKDGSKLIGTPQTPDSIQLRSAFGQIEIPTRLVEGIRFPDPEGDVPQSRNAATLLFRNGDVLHGNVLIEKIVLDMKWGEANVAKEHIKSIIYSAEPYFWHWNGQWRLDAMPVHTNPYVPAGTTVPSAAATHELSYGPY